MYDKQKKSEPHQKNDLDSTLRASELSLSVLILDFQTEHIAKIYTYFESMTFFLKLNCALVC